MTDGSLDRRTAPGRRAFEMEAFGRIDDALSAGDDRMDRMEYTIKEIKTTVDEMADIFSAAKGFFRFLGWIATGFKIIAGVVAAAITLYLSLRGMPPK